MSVNVVKRGGSGDSDGAGENRRETSKKGVPRAAWLGDKWRFEIAALMCFCMTTTGKYVSGLGNDSCVSDTEWFSHELCTCIQIR